MTSIGISEVICLICRNLLQVSSCINIFYTSLPKNGELLASFVLGTIRPAANDLQSSYLCSQCYNLFEMLEEAQCTVTNIQNEILKIFNSNEKINKKQENNRNLYDEVENFDGLNDKTVQLINTNNCLTEENHKELLLKTQEINLSNNQQINELSNEKNEEIETKKSEKNLKKNDKIMKFLCSICEKKCKTSGELKNHIKSHSSVRPYMCEKCGQAYKHKHALKIHIGMHNGINPFKCTFCDKCFTQKGALMRHLPMHTGEMPYQCELCGKRFVHHTSYNMHVLSHTGKKLFQCHICSLSLLSTSHLKRHLRVHTGEKPFSCESCGKKFAERYNLLAHQKIHDPDSGIINSKKNQFKCARCPESFDKKEALDDHMKQHDSLNVNQNGIDTNWERLSIDNSKDLHQNNFKDFDVIIRNVYQETFNVENI